MAQSMGTLKLEDDDGGEIEIKLTTRTLLRWERKFPKRSMKDLDGGSLAALYEVAWVAAVQTGQFDGSVSDFEDRYDVALDEAGEVGKSPTGRSAKR